MTNIKVRNVKKYSREICYLTRWKWSGLYLVREEFLLLLVQIFRAASLPGLSMSSALAVASIPVNICSNSKRNLLSIPIIQTNPNPPIIFQSTGSFYLNPRVGT